MLDCLVNLVGLTDRDCPCYDSAAFPDFATKNASETGYYLTDKDNGFPLLDSLFASIDCGDPNNIFAILEKARQSALNGIYTDLPTALTHPKTGRFKKRLLPFNGLVGQRRTTSTKTFSKTRAGQLWTPSDNWKYRELKDMQFVVTAIWAGFNSTGTLDVDFESNDPDFTTVTKTVNTVAGVMNRNELLEADQFTLPLWSKNTEDGYCCGDCGLRYAITYDTTGQTALANKFTCCRSGKPWGLFFEAGGFETDDVNDVLDDCGHTCNNAAQGIIVEGYLWCDGLQWLCELDQLDGWNLKSVLARTIQFGSNVYLSNHVLDNDIISYWTTVNKEGIYKTRSHSKKRFHENIAWLAEKMPIHATGCYTCKTPYVTKRSF